MTLPIPSHAMGTLQLPRQQPAPRGAYLLFGGLVAVIAVVSLLPGLIGPSLDAAVFSVVGDRLASGDLPYVDTFDHKPPGLYLMIAAGQLLGGSIGAWKVAWILSVGSVALTGVVVADTLRHLGWRRTAWVAGAVCVAELASFPLALGGGLSETAAILPAAAAMRLAVVGSRTPNRRLGAGLLAGLASAISLQAAPVLVAVLIVDAVRGPAVSGASGRVMGFLWISAGAAAAWSCLLILLGSAGATAAAFDAIVGYNGAYRSVAPLDDPMGAEALHAVLVLGPLAVPAAAGLSFALRPGPMRAAAIGSLAWVAVSVAFIAMQGRLELHYVAMLVVPLALLAPAGLCLRFRGTAPELARTGMVAGILVAAVLISGLLISVQTTLAMDVRSVQAQRSQAVAAWIEENVSTSGRVFVWGNRPELYLDIRRTPATNFVYLLPLTTPGYVTAGTVERVRQDFVQSPPAVIIDAGSSGPGRPGLPALLIPRDTVALDGRNADLLDPLRGFVRNNYVLAGVVDGWPIYVLR